MGAFMKTHFGWALASAMLLGTVGSAYAADMAVKAAPLPPAPVYNWDGCYLGVQGGGIWSRDNVRTTSSGPLFDPAAGFAFPAYGINGSSWMAGGEWGCNKQVGRVVYGFEGDLSGMNLNRSQTLLVGPSPGNVFPIIPQTVSSKMDVFNTWRGRIGFTAGNALLFVTGGLADGRVQYNYALSNVPGGGAVLTTGSEQRWEWGGIVGAGVEYGWGKWSAKAEALYYSLSDHTQNTACTVVGGGLCAPNTTFSASHQNSGVITRVGLNYHFNGPVVAKY
jgi:outer membrane immunogenic protein